MLHVAHAIWDSLCEAPSAALTLPVASRVVVETASRDERAENASRYSDRRRAITVARVPL